VSAQNRITVPARAGPSQNCFPPPTSFQMAPRPGRTPPARHPTASAVATDNAAEFDVFVPMRGRTRMSSFGRWLGRSKPDGCDPGTTSSLCAREIVFAAASITRLLSAGPRSVETSTVTAAARSQGMISVQGATGPEGPRSRINGAPPGGLPAARTARCGAARLTQARVR